MSFSSSSSAKLVGDFPRRAAYSREHGVELGTSADQTANLRDYIRNKVAVGPIGTGQDLGIGVLEPGIIRIDSTVEIDDVRGLYIVGAGSAEAHAGPRSTGGGVPISGTAIYWGGAAGGGPMLRFHNSRHHCFEHFDILLAEDSASNHASVAIKLDTENDAGVGGLRFHRIGISSPTFGNTGIQFSDASGELNSDTCVWSEIWFRNLETCVLAKSHQNLAHRFENCNFRQCKVFFHCEEGGQWFVSNAHAVNTNLPSQTLTIFKVDTGSFLAGSYHIDGLYSDRQSTDQSWTIFDFSASNLQRRDGTARNVNFRKREGTATYDNAAAAFAELSGQSTATFESCVITHQPVVRFHSTLDKDYVPQAVFRDCVVHTEKVVGTGLVTAIGGMCGLVTFQNCRRASGNDPTEEPFNCTVGYPVGGSEDIHWDPDDFDGSYEVDHEDASEAGFASSWLGMTHTPIAYWRMNDPTGSTTLLDGTGTANLTVQGATIVERGPLGLLGPRCADWSKNLVGGTTHIDTGILLSPSTTSYTFIGWHYVREISLDGFQGAVFSHIPASGSILNIWRMPSGTSRSLQVGHSGNRLDVKSLSARVWTHLITVYDHTADSLKTYANGTLYAEHTNVGIAALADGNLRIGGDGSNPIRGSISRVGVLNGALTDAQASELFLKASVQSTKPMFRPS